ncbi:MAG: glycoside hydrolase family 3 protein [Myxococcota bacterium]
MVEAVGPGTSLADRKRRAGQRLLLGFGGEAVDGDLRRLIDAVVPAGFLVFGRNLVELDQSRDLCRDLASRVDPHDPALIALDQEGGRVRALKLGASWPAARVVGAASAVDPTLPEQLGRAIGHELRAVGFNFDLAPVADVDSNPANPVIGDRSYGSDPKRVAAAVVGMVRGLQSAGVIACAKHFPGHGDTAVDSHHELPVVERDAPELRRTELPPFAAAIGAGVGAVMAGHVVYPEWDETWPATLSPAVVPRVLRGELGFGGLVLSDDLKMKAVTPRWSPHELVLGATAATVDLLLVGDVPELQLELFEALVRAQEDDPGFEDATIRAVRRIEAARERFLIDPPPAPAGDVVGSIEHRMLAALVEHLGEDGR